MMMSPHRLNVSNTILHTSIYTYMCVFVVLYTLLLGAGPWMIAATFQLLHIIHLKVHSSKLKTKNAQYNRQVADQAFTPQNINSSLKRLLW